MLHLTVVLDCVHRALLKKLQNEAEIPVDPASQQDRLLEVYHETVRQRNNGQKKDNSQIDIKEVSSFAPHNGTCNASERPSVKMLRNQFEVSPHTNGTMAHHKVLDSPTPSDISSNGTTSSGRGSPSSSPDDGPSQPFFTQFNECQTDGALLRPRATTRNWDPTALLRLLYTLPEAPKQPQSTVSYVNIEGYLEKLPTGRRKATFWNAWKRRFFKAKDGYLYYYQNTQTEKPSMMMQLMGGKVDCLETTILGVEDRQPVVSTMLGIDDGKGHYVVVKCSSRQETERWRLALQTHTAENFGATYVRPWPVPHDPALLRSTILIDLGSCSIRGGILCSQPTLPQVFFPTIMAVDRETGKKVFGCEALLPEVRRNSTVLYPVRPSEKITKYSVDLGAVSGLFEKVFTELNVDQKDYDVILSVPHTFGTGMQKEILKILFDQFGVEAVNMTHQSVLALYAYNATSGIVVDIGERMDIVPINDGYILEGGVSRVPYGGFRILDHLRHFLLQKQYSFASDAETYVIRYVLENLCYCAQIYNMELTKFTCHPDSIEQSLSIKEFFDEQSGQWDSVSLDSGRFQATEGLFNPDAWGLDNLGVHKLVHKAVQECSLDIRKEMTRSIFLAGGVTQLPGFAERLTIELDRLTPPTLTPKVHASPYRYHASYLGATVLGNSPGVNRLKIRKEEWFKSGPQGLSMWTL